MTPLERVHELRNERDKVRFLLDDYNRVREHILPKLAPDSIVIVMLDEQRYLLGLEVERIRGEIRMIRAKCSHAWEFHGDARPPFWKCVNCADATEIKPDVVAQRDRDRVHRLKGKGRR